MLVVALRGSLFYYTRFCLQCNVCGHHPVRTLLEPHFVSSAQSQLYYVVLAECQLMGVHDGLTHVGRY